MESKYEKLKLKNQLCFPIYLCSKEIIRRYTKYLKEINLTYTQYIVMMFFWEIKKANVKDVGQILCLDPSTLTPLLKTLEKKGYIKRAKSKKDERLLDVSITKSGEKLKEKALLIPDNMKKCLGIDDDEIKVLYKLIYKVLFNVEKTSGNMSR